MKAAGGSEFRRYELGEKITQRQSIRAKCFDCMGKYADGKIDCEIPECSLYPWMPYGAIWKGRPRNKIAVDPQNPIHGDLKMARTEAVHD